MDQNLERQWASFEGRLLMLGFGSIGRGLLPLVLRHIAITPERIAIMSPEGEWEAMAAAQCVAYAVDARTPDNYRQLLAARLGPGDFLLNLSVDVSSRDLIAWCQEQGVLYLDACVGPWAGGHFDASVAPARRSNYALRAAALGLRDTANVGPTAILSHGVNPGLVSHFVKQALLNLAADLLPGSAEPRERRDWAKCARRLGVRAIHIAERDTQTALTPKQPGEFVNTWSIEGFAGAACQPAELGWGSHERYWPASARGHDFGSRAAIWLERPGASPGAELDTPGGSLSRLPDHPRGIPVHRRVPDAPGG